MKAWIWSVFSIIYKRKAEFITLTVWTHQIRIIFSQIFTVKKLTWGSTWRYLSFVLNFWDALARKRNITQASWLNKLRVMTNLENEWKMNRVLFPSLLHICRQYFFSTAICELLWSLFSFHMLTCSCVPDHCHKGRKFQGRG